LGRIREIHQILYTIIHIFLSTNGTIVTKLAGRYQIIQELGGGAFAVTYLAKDDMQPSKPFCVVKQLRPIYTNAQVLGLFEKEAVILEKLGIHPQIPTLLAHFQENDKFYIIQEYIDGHDLSTEIFAGKRLSEGYVIKLLQDILEALAFVHKQGVIHRDIKPANLMRRQEDGKIYLIDFGAVKEIGSIILNSQGQITPSLIIIGTPGYMPTEQGIGQPCYASDIYAVGMTAIQALTGIDPMHLQEDPPTGEIIWRYGQLQISEYLAEVLTTMVRRYFKMRYPSAVEALEALKPLLEASTGTIVFTPAKTAYCNEVVKRLKQGNGKLSPVALQLLETERKKLSLSPAEAKEMYEFALSQAQEYERKLNEYEDLFFKVVKVQFPFNQETEAELQEYRDSLGLKPEDVVNIEERVLAQRQVEYERQPKKPNPPPPQPEKFLGIPVTTFEFETAKLILKSGVFGFGKGSEIQRSRKKSRLFIEGLGNGVNLEMVAIPGGTFIMGSPENEEGYDSSQSPQHQVTVPPFFMGKYPVTQKQWQAVAALEKVKIDLESDLSYFKGDNLPVERVSWGHAQEFCARLSKKTNKAYRLPSEAEWEYACRAGTTTPFYFGETISTDLANYNGDYTYGNGVKGEYRKKTTEVGIFPANPFGLYDMCGNVWEWCEDGWHENYINAPMDGSVWTSLSNKTRPLRGGSWITNPELCRSAFRNSYVAGFVNVKHGFRVVCVAAWTY